MPTSSGSDWLYVDCTSDGLASTPSVPIFQVHIYISSPITNNRELFIEIKLLLTNCIYSGQEACSPAGVTLPAGDLSVRENVRKQVAGKERERDRNNVAK